MCTQITVITKTIQYNYIMCKFLFKPQMIYNQNGLATNNRNTPHLNFYKVVNVIYFDGINNHSNLATHVELRQFVVV